MSSLGCRRRILSVPSRLACAAALLLSMSACGQTPEQKLLGRWYSGTMSIRFREDGGVVLNTPTGLGIGRYVFHPGIPTAATGSLEPNLTVDLVRNNARTQIDFHVEFLNGDRLRLTNLSAEVPVRNRRAGVPREFAVLKRATGNESESTPTKVATR